MTFSRRSLLLLFPSAIVFLVAGPVKAHDVIGSHNHDHGPDEHEEPEMSFTNIDGSHHHRHEHHRRRHLEEEPQPSPEPGDDWYEGSEVDDPFSEASFEACGTEDMSDEEIFLAQELEVEFWEQQNQRPSFFQAVWNLVRFGIFGNRNGVRRRRALQNLFGSIGGIGGGGGGGGSGGGQSIPTYYHIIQPSGGSSYTPTDDGIREQHQILNDAYSGIFSFELKEITRTTNSAWYDYPSSGIGSSSGDLSMKQALRRGGTESLNIYLNKGAGYVLSR